MLIKIEIIAASLELLIETYGEKKNVNKLLLYSG